jgi:hypothetical protein
METTRKIAYAFFLGPRVSALGGRGCFPRLLGVMSTEERWQRYIGTTVLL